jgi:putative endonuclease
MAAFFRQLFQWLRKSTPIPAGKTHDRARGSQAEQLAYDFLRGQGYRIVARNYRRKFGEIDLIGWDGGILAFIEVKYRSGKARGRPVDSVHRHKRRQIVRVAKEYRIRHKLHDINYRFDVLSLQGSLEAPCLELIKNAFPETWR